MMKHAGAAALFLAAAMAAVAASAYDDNTAKAGIEDVRTACAEDGGRLWGVSLCGPILLVDPKSREIVADRNTATGRLKQVNGLFTGLLPIEVSVANTAIEWEGVRWIMVALPLPEHPVERRRLLMHEAFHREQAAIGVPMASPSPAHLATKDGRVLMRMEWRALAAALSAATPQARSQPIADALAFRRARRGLTAEAAEQEIQLELNEGLAEYTGQKLSGRAELAKHVVGLLGRAEVQPSFVRSFAYGSGPAYGLLLDEADPKWRTRIVAARDLGALLAGATGLAPTPDLKAAGARYGEGAVAEEETERAEALARTQQALRAKLVDGPTLILPFKDISVSFDPNTLVPLPPHGTAYPTMRASDRWGVLTVTDGALIDPAWAGVRVAAPVRGAAPQLSGPGWTLSLAAGWSLGGSRKRPVLVAPAGD